MDRYTNALIQHRWVIALFSLILVIAATYGATYTVVEVDYEVFFDGENKRLQAHQEMEHLYGRQDFTRIGVEPKQGSVLQPHTLQIISDITRDAWLLPYVRRVDSLTNTQLTLGKDDDMDVSDLFDMTMEYTDKEFEFRKAYALSDPLVVNLSINPQGTVGGILATITLPKNDTEASLKASRATTALVNQYRAKYPDINFYVTGSVIINEQFFNESTTGTAKLIAIMLVLMLALISILLRSAVAIGCVLLLIISSVGAAIGIASWIGIPFTGPSSTSPIIIAAIVVANSVHIMSVLLTSMKNGSTKAEAIAYTLKSNIEPVFLTSLTTTIGFICLNISDVPPFRFLGNTAAIGVVASFILTFTLLPALLAILPLKVKNQANQQNTDDSKAWSNIGNFIIKQRKFFTIGMIIFAVSSSIFITRIEIDDSLIKYFDEDMEFRQEAEYLMENLSFFYSVSLSIPSKGEGGINDPEYMKNIDMFASWAKQQPEVQTTRSFINIMKNLNRSMHGNSADFYRLPEGRELAAQYMLLYEMSLPYGMELDNQLSMDKSSSRFIVGFKDVSSNDMRKFSEKAEAWINNNFPDYMKHTTPTGPPLLFAYIWYDSVITNLTGMIFAVLMISIVIAIAMRSITLGLLSLIPNLIPAAMAFGVWGLIKGQVDIGSSIVAIIAFGIVVDDTIHFMSKFRVAYQTLGYTTKESVVYAFTCVGKALTITSIVLVAGFSVLVISNYTMNSSMGLLTCILISFALAFDFLLLPSLLIAVFPERSAKYKQLGNTTIDLLEPKIAQDTFSHADAPKAS